MTLWHGISRLRIKKIKATNNNVSPGLVQYWCMTYFSKLILSLSLELTVADMCILFQRWLISDRGCITVGSGNINTGDGNEFDLDRIIRLGHTTSLRSKTIWKLDVYILDRLEHLQIILQNRVKIKQENGCLLHSSWALQFFSISDLKYSLRSLIQDHYKKYILPLYKATHSNQVKN